MPGKGPIVMFEAIQQQYQQHPEQGLVQLICTGALSNAAMLLLLYPEVKPMIEITIMGGSMGVSAAHNQSATPEMHSTPFQSSTRACYT